VRLSLCGEATLGFVTPAKFVLILASVWLGLESL